MLIDSEALKKLNTVKLYYTYTDDNGNEKMKNMFSQEDSPLYLLDSSLPAINMNVEAEDLWSTSKNLFGKKLRTIAQGLTSADLGIGGFANWTGFSGTMDLRSKFIFTGSAPQEFAINCMLVNKNGWDRSIAPVLNELKDWILPDTVKDVEGNEINIGQPLVNKYNEIAGNDTAISETTGSQSKDLNSLFKFLAIGVKEFTNWIGDAKLLNIPKQYQLLDNGSCDAYIQIGRYKLNHVFITGVNIEIPRTFMYNENGEPEPDHVNISMKLKTLRQTTKATFKF